MRKSVHPTAVVVVTCHRPVACCGVVQVRYRYRIYPAPGQRQALARVSGCARMVCNDCLRLRDEAYAGGEKISDTGVQRRVITLAKGTLERAWLGEVAMGTGFDVLEGARTVEAKATLKVTGRSVVVLQRSESAE